MAWYSEVAARDELWWHWKLYQVICICVPGWLWIASNELWYKLVMTLTYECVLKELSCSDLPETDASEKVHHKFLKLLREQLILQTISNNNQSLETCELPWDLNQVMNLSIHRYGENEHRRDYRLPSLTVPSRKLTGGRLRESACEFLSVTELINS